MLEVIPIIILMVLFGTSMFLRKIAVDGMSPYYLQILSSIVYTCLVPLWLFLAPKWVQTPSFLSIMCGFGAILTNVVGAVIFGFMLKNSSSPTVLATGTSASPLITAILAYMILGETFTHKKALATMIVLTGMVLFHS